MVSEISTSRRGSMAKLREAAKAEPQVHMPMQLFTGHGMATRVVFIPAGHLAFGGVHKQGQHNFLMQGRVKLARQDGSTVELSAPEIIIAPPGESKGVLALTDTVWATTLITDKTDAAAITRDVIENADDIQQPGDTPCLT